MPEAWDPDASFDLDHVRARIARHFPELVDDSLRVAGEGWDFVLIGTRDDRVVRVPKRRVASGASVYILQHGCDAEHRTTLVQNNGKPEDFQPLKCSANRCSRFGIRCRSRRLS